MIELIHYAIFALLALVTVGGALKVATTRSMIHAAFWLFPVFAGVAGFYLYLGAQFLAAIQVLLYIGAILVLIIFAVTLTRKAADTDEAQTNRFGIPVALSAVILLLALVGAVLTVPVKAPIGIDVVELAPGLPVAGVRALGLVLLQQYLLPFEIASILLLGAMIGALVLARKERTPAPQDEAVTESDDVTVDHRELLNV